MGTLFNQSPRGMMRIDQKDIQNFVEECKEISKETDCNIRDVIECAKILELRRKTSAYINNGDIFDEQMAGFGELIRDTLAGAIHRLGTGNAATEMGAIEALSVSVKEGFDHLAHVIEMKAIGE